MEDLALSLDRQNAADLMRPQAPATPEHRVEQPIKDTEQYAPLPVLSPDADKPSSPIEASQQDSGFSDSSRLSLEDTIRKSIPDKSDLANSLGQRHTWACLIGDGIEWTTEEQSDLDEINERLNKAEARGRPSLLVIQDANIHWVKALCTKYPNSLRPELLARHIIRFDKFQFTNSIDDAIQSYLWTHYPDAGFRVTSEGRFMSISTRGMFEDEENQFNLDFIVGSYRGDASTHINSVDTRRRYRRTLIGRSDVFEKDEQKNWRRISVRLSCFRLAADFRKTGTLTCCGKVFTDD